MALDRNGNTLYCSSFSKTIAPGYRIGWIVTGRHMQRVLERKFAFTLCGPALPQAAFADFLSSGGYDNHLRRMRRTFEGNIANMIRTVERAFPGDTRVTRPAGGFVLWLELPKPLESRQLFNEALGEGICFAPGDVFSASGRFGNCLRLSCGHSWDARIEEGLTKLGALAYSALSRATSRRAPFGSHSRRHQI
jgi:DNA-binding transcriptional MocR family regulator